MSLQLVKAQAQSDDNLKEPGIGLAFRIHYSWKNLLPGSKYDSKKLFQAEVITLHSEGKANAIKLDYKIGIFVIRIKTKTMKGEKET